MIVMEEAMKRTKPHWQRVLASMITNYGKVIGQNYGSANGPAFIDMPAPARTPKPKRRGRPARRH